MLLPRLPVTAFRGDLPEAGAAAALDLEEPRALLREDGEPAPADQPPARRRVIMSSCVDSGMEKGGSRPEQRLCLQPGISRDMKNGTAITEFILLGFPGIQGLQVPVFTVIFLIYILTLAGNGLIIVLVWAEPRLQTPMYFFLCNLSFLEIWYTTTVIPKLLETFVVARTAICTPCCLLQSFFHFFLGTTEFFILTSMSFDRYLAICKPLRYPAIMTRNLCLQLALSSWAVGFAIVFCQTMLLIQLPFCGDNVINHFYCDVGPILKAACGDTGTLELLGLLATLLVIPGSLLFTMISYGSILSTILKIPSAPGRQKAFSTCASHLTWSLCFTEPSCSCT
ncbi:hypothetical protein QTO34_012017 [Cnephaeus nilssonii]|uniref:Olfactory receptor n=1 Tax=Cnephaeus nilssonii TaxID=3371016 RepID=A0AA40HC62_CNENI|nr:hypothetical protein QTO34_012017 [Eptesicus nilssonii]